MDTERTPEDSEDRTQSSSPDDEQSGSGEPELETAECTDVHTCRHGVLVHAQLGSLSQYCTPIYHD